MYLFLSQSTLGLDLPRSTVEVRVRAGFEEARFEAAEAETSKYVKMDNSQDLKNQKNPRFWRKVKHEVMEIGRVTLNMLKGQGSKFSYLFIPAFISFNYSQQTLPKWS